jgi:hypothetical protein
VSRSGLQTALALGLLAALCDPRLGAAETPPVAGTNVILQPPTGFSRSNRFAGFEHPEGPATILVAEVPAPVEQLQESLYTAERVPRGLKVRDVERVRVSGREGLLYEAAHTVDGNPVEKWILFLGDGSASLMITATYPTARAGELRDVLRAAVLSARWERSGTPQPFDGLPFRLAPGERLKVAGRLSGLLVLTEQGGMETRPGEPYFVAGSSTRAVAIEDVGDFARLRLARTPNIEVVTVLSGGPVTVDGTSAYELVADARVRASDLAIRVYQVVVPDGGHYYLLQGFVGAERAEEYMVEFRRVTASVRRVR